MFAAASMGRFAFGGVAAGDAKLRVGVLSDIHINSRDGAVDGCAGVEMLEKALRYFGGRNVDAVLIAGDLADGGIGNELLAVGNVWRKVFPQNRRADGGKVEKVFVYGNHDIDGWRFMGNAKKVMDTGEKLAAQAIGKGDNRARFWREAFDEDYAPMYVKDIKGYKFVGIQFGEFDMKGAVAAFLEAHRPELAGAKPFFYTQHYHPKGTCSAPWTWGQDSGNSTVALKAFPNAVSFTGHSHTPLTDDRTLWLGDFTSVGTASLKYLIPFGGRENSRIFGVEDSKTQQMPFLGCGEQTKQVAVTFPNVRGLDGGARAFDYEVRVEATEVDREKVWMTKRVYSPHYYWAAERDSETVTCLFAVSELPPPNGKLDPRRGTVYRFAVSPANSFGAHGRAIYSDNDQNANDETTKATRT